MANISQLKRQKMIEFLNKLKQEHQDDASLRALEEIATALNEKKYGLVWEKHTEKVDEMLEHNIPVFCEDESRKIIANENDGYNFLLEGDNLHSLKLLEKTHKGKIDVIYIDPPYNTGSDKFKYDDKLVDLNDGFRHSRWASMIYNRLSILKELFSENWVLFISIDDNEFASLRFICDEIFGEQLYIGNIGWESKTKSQNTKTSFSKLQPKIEHILCYGSEGTKHKFNLIKKGEREYPLKDNIGIYREHVLEVMNSKGVRGRETMIFDISDGVSTVSLPDGKQWQLGQDQVATYKSRGDLYIKNNKVIIKMRPSDERTEKTVPFWAFFDKSIGTAESAKKELNTILGDDHGFDTVKPTELIKRLIFHASSNNSTILDFFAGSGTTGHAVIQLNKEDGGNRKYILCTNNENNICEEVTYQRLKNIQDELPHNLKYFKTEFISKYENDEDEATIYEKMLEHIKELIELEYHIEIDNVNYIILNDEDQLETVIENIKENGKLFITSGIFLSRTHQRILNDKNVTVIDIPEYYYRNELKEIGEL